MIISSVSHFIQKRNCAARQCQPEQMDDSVARSLAGAMSSSLSDLNDAVR